ncbi:hypothetical protein KUL49_25630 [Alteromonas sp. KUL49]|nr:hypothetical protein KUL49_25630 [Alteromonas sp. KUL49]
MSAQHDVEQGNAVSYYEVEVDTQNLDLTLLYVQQASVFNDIRQQPSWSFVDFVVDVFNINSSHVHLHSEPILSPWFNNLTSMRFRVEQWKSSNSLYRQLAIAG